MREFEIYCPVHGVIETIKLPNSYDFDNFEGEVACGRVVLDSIRSAFGDSGWGSDSVRLRIEIKQGKISKLEAVDEHI